MKLNPIISAHDLSIGYPKTRKRDKTTLHRHLSFELNEGELTCLLGTNGSGKSTLLRTISGLQAAASGEIMLREKGLHTYSEQELSTLLGLVLTDKTTAGGFTVSELVALGRYPYTGFFGNLTEHDRKIVDQAMCDVGIAHKADSYIAELSDGERQKVMIAKALAQECPIIILDEPTAFLDVVNRIDIMNLLRHLSVTKNKTILLSTHDIELALLLADRLWLLDKEKGLLCGVTEDLILSNAIDEYIGNGQIFFEKESGRFVSKQQTDRKIHLRAEGNLFYWAKNLLSRNGYELSDNCGLEIDIISPNNIVVKKQSETENLKSFEELNLWLKN